jgi:hypothetical protein
MNVLQWEERARALQLACCLEHDDSCVSGPARHCRRTRATERGGSIAEPVVASLLRPAQP